MKTFLVFCSGHECNNSYVFEGNNLKDSIVREMKKKKSFQREIFEESMKTADEVYKWIVEERCGCENVDIFVSNSKIRSVNLES